MILFTFVILVVQILHPVSALIRRESATSADHNKPLQPMVGLWLLNLMPMGRRSAKSSTFCVRAAMRRRAGARTINEAANERQGGLSRFLWRAPTGAPACGSRGSATKKGLSPLAQPHRDLYTAGQAGTDKRIPRQRTSPNTPEAWLSSERSHSTSAGPVSSAKSAGPTECDARREKAVCTPHTRVKLSFLTRSPGDARRPACKLSRQNIKW